MKNDIVRNINLYTSDMLIFQWFCGESVVFAEEERALNPEQAGFYEPPHTFFTAQQTDSKHQERAAL